MNVELLDILNHPNTTFFLLFLLLIFIHLTHAAKQVKDTRC